MKENKKRIAFYLLPPATYGIHYLPVAYELEKMGHEVILAYDPNDYESLRPIVEFVEGLLHHTFTKEPFYKTWVSYFMRRKYWARTNMPRLLQENDAVLVSDYPKFAWQSKVLAGSKRGQLFIMPHGNGPTFPAYTRDADQRICYDEVMLENQKTFGYAAKLSGYPKFDLVRKYAVSSPFDNDKLTVLVNPHHSINCSWKEESWKKGLIQFMKENKRFNFIFSPHPALIRNDPQEFEQLTQELQNEAHILLDFDLDSMDKSMLGFRYADVYVSDGSSQLYEYLAINPKMAAVLLDPFGAYSGTSEKALGRSKRSHGMDEVIFSQFRACASEVIADISELGEAIEHAQQNITEERKAVVRSRINDLGEGQNAQDVAKKILESL